VAACQQEHEPNSRFELLQRWYAPWVIEAILKEWHAVLDARPRPDDEPRIHVVTHEWSIVERIHDRPDPPAQVIPPAAALRAFPMPGS
jgi:hypothetical protein